MQVNFLQPMFELSFLDGRLTALAIQMSRFCFPYESKDSAEFEYHYYNDSRMCDISLRCT